MTDAYLARYADLARQRPLEGAAERRHGPHPAKRRGASRNHAAWWSLWRRVPAATPFQSPAWLVPWWRSLPSRRPLRRRSGTRRELIGLAPLYVEAAPPGVGSCRSGSRWSDYLDILLDPDWASAAGAAVADGLRADGSWDRLDLEELRPGAAAFGLPFARAAECTPQSACPTLVLAADLDATLPNQSAAS